MNKEEAEIWNHIRYHRTQDGKLRGVSLEFRSEKEMNEFLQLYADEQSREVATDFLVDTAELYVQNFHSKEKALKYYDKWKSNQEGE